MVRFPAVPLVTLAALSSVVPACTEPEPPTFTYYDEVVGPVLAFSCQQQTAGCHVADENGNAAGNLDLSSYDALQRRRDALHTYGPYTTPLLLLKGGDEVTIRVETLAGVIEVPSDIRHAAGSTFEEGTDAYVTLKRWMENGATREGTPATQSTTARGPCRTDVPARDGFDPEVAPEGFETFSDAVQTVFTERCASSNCHGSRAIDLQLTCGDSEAERRWNFFVARQYVAAEPSQSELLQKPLTVLAGGTFHQGGDVFGSTDDGGYDTLLDWARDVGAPPPPARATEAGFQFFVNRVQPQMVRKGCMFLNCHSGAMFNDMRLRGGSNGTFSPVTLEANYHFARGFLAVESDEVNDSRIVAKNLFEGEIQAGVLGAGIRHRGGSLLEDFSDPQGVVPASPDQCPPYPCGPPWDAESCPPLGEELAYCTFVEWHRIEREQAIDEGLLDAEVLSGIVVVTRPPNDDPWIAYDVFRGGADLVFHDASVAANGAPSVAGSRSLLGSCGLGGSPDVRSPSVSRDGNRIYFAARAAAGDPLRIYSVGADGTACALVPGVAASETSSDGILVHDTDPIEVADGRIVFASSRGLLECGLNDEYCGPTRSLSDLRPNLNLYVFDPEAGTTRQLTYLLNQEMAPTTMRDGRIILTTEKRAPELYQLSARRLNLDGGDYHPLVGQRARDRGDDDPPGVGGIGFEQLTDVTELVDRNFAFVLSNHGDRFGGGTLAVLNRSVGVDQPDRDAGDRFYVHSIKVLDPDGPANLPTLSRGSYRGPAGLPSGWILVSADPNVSPANLTAGAVDYGLYAIDPHSNERVELVDAAGVWEVDAAPVYARPYREIFRSAPDEPNGTTRVVGDATDAIVHMADWPMLATLLFMNTREGRPIDHAIQGIGVLEDLPPPAGVDTFGGAGGDVHEDAFGTMYFRRRALGKAHLESDGSVRFRVPGGRPLVLQTLNDDLEEIAVQREEMQYAPGERITQSFPRPLFNGLCGGCHGSITGRELESAVNPDILTGASITLGADADVVDF